MHGVDPFLTEFQCINLGQTHQAANSVGGGRGKEADNEGLMSIGCCHCQIAGGASTETIIPEDVLRNVRLLLVNYAQKSDLLTCTRRIVLSCYESALIRDEKIRNLILVLLTHELRR